MRFLAFFVLLLLSSCASMQYDVNSDLNSNRGLPDTFTDENILKVSEGMPQTAILNTFGNPNNIKSEFCINGRKQGTCKIWSYGRIGFGYAEFSLIEIKPGLFVLRSFDISRK